MWLFTKYGFYSAVCSRSGDGSLKQPVDPDKIMVRARVRAHLDNLKQAFPAELGACEVRESSTNDYRWRLFVAKPVWSQVVGALVMDVDYDNFKGKVHVVMPQDDRADYTGCLHSVWGCTHRMQMRDKYGVPGGKGRKSKSKSLFDQINEAPLGQDDQLPDDVLESTAASMHDDVFGDDDASRGPKQRRRDRRARAKERNRNKSLRAASEVLVVSQLQDGQDVPYVMVLNPGAAGTNSQAYEAAVNAQAVPLSPFAVRFKLMPWGKVGALLTKKYVPIFDAAK